MTQKTTSNNTSREIQAVTQMDFLSALYPQSSGEHWLELRCIHPETGEVRTLWTQLNKSSQRDDVLKQADKLNAEGFGLFFAPCLRKERKGSVASAILLPAMWIDIDCDDDPQKREKGMTKLHDFDPAPSIIVDSGGGWHAYWLLNEPFVLETEEAKQKVSQIMQGLFTALDGDAGYVKSVASIMRLPNSINTKPERNNALVKLMEWHPKHRYSLSNFEWLEVKSKPQNGYLPVFSTNGNGHHPLPSRTEQYLASGAYDGNHNAELFAAACQMRDAGYSQSDTERELLARHIADGIGNENSASREKEARATIASAYSQPAREPIASPNHHARQVVQQLVGQYQVEQKPERPTTAQIVEAVEACIHLNPIEWAEERQRLKNVCGDGLKISDIDRLYKEKKKAVERQQQQEYVDTESYLMLDGKIIYRKETYRGTMEKTVTDWAATALYQTCQIDDDGKELHVTTIELQRGSSSKKLDIPGDVFVDDIALRRFIGASAGSQYVVRAGMSKHLVPAIVQLSGEFPIHRHYNFMGWMELDGCAAWRRKQFWYNQCRLNTN